MGSDDCPDRAIAYQQTKNNNNKQMSIGNQHSTTKRSIQKRMLRVAATHLGVKRVELLDPLVALFVESLAEETYKLFGEVGNIESRMQEALASMLLTDTSLSAQPAHCILHAAPEMGESTLTKETAFILEDRRQLPKNVKELTFYPVCHTNIRKGGIRYIIHNGQCHQIENDLEKTPMIRSNNKEFARTNSFWIGLELDETVETLKNLSFYFDFPRVQEKEEQLRLLSFMTWKLNGKELSVQQGLYTIPDNREENVINLFENQKMVEKVDKAILESYDKQFQTITDDVNIVSEKSLFPKELTGYFPKHSTEDLTTPLLWLEINYPPQLKASAIEAMTVCINAFPVANKQLHTKTMDMNSFLQVIPLETDNHESLLSVHSVTDSLERSYYELAFDDTEEKQYKTYSLRRGGYERYSKREQREYLDNLVHLLESRSSVKTEKKADDEKMDALLSEVHGLVRHLKKAISQSKDKTEIQHYILIDEPDGDETFFVKYWTTNSEQANRLGRYTALDCLCPDTSIDAATVFTLSETVGGKYAPQFTNRQTLRRKSQSDRVMLVTNEDIIGFCKAEFGGMLAEVKIAKGITIEEDKGGDFVCTTDIRLVPAKGYKSLLHKRDNKIFEKRLRKRTPETFNCRVFVEN